jgi:hypothetical protein
MIAQVQARIGTRGNTTVAHTAKGLDAFRPKPMQVLIHQWAQVEGPQEDNGLVGA